MTVVNPDSIAGITSVTSSGTTLEFYDVNGNLLDVSANLTGELTVGTGATISSPAANVIDFETNGAERARITSAGNVGIGTDNPTVKLTVSSDSPAVCDIHHVDGGTNDEARIMLGALTANPPSNRGAGIAALNNGAGHDLLIKCSASHGAGPTEKLRIDSDGKILAGTTSSRAVAGGYAKLQIEAASSEGVSLIRTTNDSGAAYFSLGKVRTGGSNSGRCIAGDNIGAISWNPSDGTDLNHASAEIQCLVASGIGGNDVPGDLVFKTNVGTTTTTERLRITSGGAVLIKATSTSNSETFRIHEADSGKVIIKLTNATTGTAAGDGFEFGLNASEQVEFVHKESEAMLFATAATERLRIESDGKLLLGDTNTAWNSNSNDYKMSIKESSNENAAIMFLDTDSMRGGICGIAKGTNQILTGTANVDFVVGSTYNNTIIVSGNGSSATPIERMRITSAGNVGVNNTSPTQARFVVQQDSGNTAALIKANTGASLALGGVSQPRILLEAAASASDFIVYTAGGSSWGSPSWAERLRIDSDGLLTVKRSHTNATSSNWNGAAVSIQNTHDTDNNSSCVWFTNSAGSIDAAIQGIHQDAAGSGGSRRAHIQFGTSGANSSGSVDERLTITSEGDIHFGENPDNTLWDATGNNGVWYRRDQGSLASATRSATGYSSYYINKNTGSGTSDYRWVDFYWDSNQRGRISFNGASGTTYGTSSDYRLKENVVAITDGIAKVKQLKPYRFNFKSDTTDKVVQGFFAHEAQEIVPYAATGTKDQVVTQAAFDEGSQPEQKAVGEPIYQDLDYAKFTPILTAAVKELIAEVETLKAKVAANEAGDTTYNAKIDKIIDYFKL
tara:strand:+ start:397 stop:2940 length:2544 start_codon:yes stop_codon:yes gene_type:complete